MRAARWSMWALFLIGVAAGAIGHALLGASAPAAHAQPPATASVSALEKLAAEIESIKGKLPSQSHTMQDVSYHFANLWFAGQAEKWPLAEFYLAETRSHMRWAVRVIPVRKDTKGNDVDLAPILEGFENGPLKLLQESIAARDGAAFEKQYRAPLETCYGCHKASDKPYLRPQIPERPESPLINFNPLAEWPQ